MDPFFAPAYLGRAQLALRNNPEADVLADLDKAISVDPSYGEAYLLRVNLLIQRGELKAASSDLEKLGNLLPDSPWIPYYAAQIAFLQEKPDEALQDAQEANQRDLTFLPAYRMLGMTNLLKGDVPAALKALELYTTYQTDDALAWALLGQAYYQSGSDFEAASKAFDRAIELNDQLMDTYYYRGMAYVELGEGQKAVNDLVVARRLNRDSFDISLALGRALLLAGRVEDARAQLTGTLDMAQDETQQGKVYYWRAQALEAAGSFPAARKDWRALLNLPKGAVPEDWLVRADLGLSAIYTPTPTPTIVVFESERHKEVP